jgi:hypothetical protein
MFPLQPGFEEMEEVVDDNEPNGAQERYHIYSDVHPQIVLIAHETVREHGKTSGAEGGDGMKNGVEGGLRGGERIAPGEKQGQGARPFNEECTRDNEERKPELIVEAVTGHPFDGHGLGSERPFAGQEVEEDDDQRHIADPAYLERAEKDDLSEEIIERSDVDWCKAGRRNSGESHEHGIDEKLRLPAGGGNGKAQEHGREHGDEEITDHENAERCEDPGFLHTIHHASIIRSAVRSVYWIAVNGSAVTIRVLLKKG